MHLDFLPRMAGVEEDLAAEAYVAPHGVQSVQRDAEGGGFGGKTESRV